MGKKIFIFLINIRYWIREIVLYGIEKIIFLGEFDDFGYSSKFMLFLF